MKRSRSGDALARIALAAALVGALGAAGCLVEVGGPDPTEPTTTATTSTTSSTKSALAVQDDVPDGTACYQDVPMRKGTMSYGVCCFDDTTKGTSECITCDQAHTCTVGGAEPGCLEGCLYAVSPSPVQAPAPTPIGGVRAVTFAK